MTKPCPPDLEAFKHEPADYEQPVGCVPWTPGPWFAVPYGDGNDTVICRDEAGNQRIAFMAIPGSRDETERRKSWAEIKANARLIAVAPLMLDALDATAADVAEMTNWPDAVIRGWAYAVARNAQAAIAKARGEA